MNLSRAKGHYRQRIRDRGINEWALLNELSTKQTEARFDLAHELLDESLRMRKDKFGDEHARIAELYYTMASVYRAEGKSNHAIALEIQAKEMSH